MECSDDVLSLVVLPPDAGDNENLVSDEEELLKDPETAHESAALLVVEEEVEVDAEETIHQRRWKKTSEFVTTMSSRQPSSSRQHISI